MRALQRGLLALGLVVGISGTAAAQAPVIRYWTEGASHSAEIAAAMAKLATATGGTATPFSGTDDPSWEAALAGTDIIFIPQTSSTSSLLPNTRSDIANFVYGGGTLLVLWEDENVSLLNDIMGSSMTWTSGGDSDGLPQSRVPRRRLGRPSDQHRVRCQH